MQPPRSIREIAALVRAGSLTPSAIIREFVTTVEQKNPALNALRFVNASGAQERAAQLERELKSGSCTGRLLGVPFAVKDHINITGMPRSEGTSHGAIEHDTMTATVARLIIDEGAICMGKTNMAEHGWSYYTENRSYGRTHNPYRHDYSPGGSGGGDGAAVGAGLVQFSIGADSGGSIRVPANFCGVYGHYPTPGTVSNEGLTSYPHTISSLFRSIGPIARTLDDLEILARILTQFTPGDPHSIAWPTSGEVSGPRKRFAWFTTLKGARSAPEICQAISDTVRRLEAAGYTGREETPNPFEEAFEPFIILGAQAILLINDLLDAAMGTTMPRDQESPSTTTLRARIAAELPPLTADSLLLFWHQVSTLRMRIAEYFKSVDFVISPVTATTPPAYGTDRYAVGDQGLPSQLVFHFANAVNVLGLPAIAFPTGRTPSGLPLGLQIIGPRFSDFDLMRILRDIGCA